VTGRAGGGWPRSFEELTAELPPAVAPALRDLERVRRTLLATDTVVLVLDDDPTGSQVVHGVDVVTTTEPDELAALLDAPTRLGFVLTNSRALDAPDAVRLNAEVARVVLGAAAARGTRVEFVSRGDSTLRGHVPDEPDALLAACADAGTPIDLVTLCPAFPEAGRITIGGLHLVETADGFVPAGDSEFARDATFGYRASRLADWLEERTAGRIRAEQVAVVSVTELRTDPTEEVAARLAARPRGSVVTFDAVEPSDLSLVATVLAELRVQGRRLLHRAGPSLLGPLVGLSPIEPLGAAQLGGGRAAAGGGLVVVGSHTSVSSGQLDRLLESHPELLHVELDVASVLEDVAAEVGRVVEVLAPHARGRDAVLSTTRRRRDGADRAASLALARRVSDAVVEVVATVVRRAAPAYLVAKGGITSSEIATRALGVRRARVLGQLRRGQLSVWELPADSACPGLRYVVFPGNVGDDETLVEVVTTLRRAART
jgi:uncharacterized protein YgbK (DUF1537 family)